MTTASLSKQSKLGVATVCMVEMWERFGFYTVVSLLVLFMTKRYDYSDEQAYNIFAAYTSLLYITPSIGGYFADHFLGYHRSLILGAFVMVLGYVFIALPTHNFFFLGLSTIIIGMGFFKSMPYAIMGRLYKDDLAGLDRGCTYYYLAIQVGAIMPVMCGGFMVRYFGWHFTFSIAAIGMSLAALIFILMHNFFKTADNTVGLSRINPATLPAFILGSITTALGFTYLLEHIILTRIVVILGTIGVIAYISYYCRRLTAKERGRIIAAIILSTVAVIYTMLYLQQSSSIVLFTDRNINRLVFGIEIPPSAFWLLAPVWIGIMGLVLGQVYKALSKANKGISIASKFVFGLFCMGIGFGVLYFARYTSAADFHASPFWLVGSYAFQCTAELLINALGPAMILQFVPRQLSGIMMGIWFLAAAGGGLLAGVLANMMSIPDNISSAAESMQIYTHAFGVAALLTIGLSVLYLLALPLIHKLGGKTDMSVTHLAHTEL